MDNGEVRSGKGIYILSWIELQQFSFKLSPDGFSVLSRTRSHLTSVAGG